MAKQSKNDPDRLTQLQQSDLAESRVNEEFVDWLKRWGNTILLVVLAVALAGVGWNWLQRQADAERDEAWANLDDAQLPTSLEEVAREAKGVDSVSTLALLNAADQYLNSIQTGNRFDREPTDEDYQLDAETRALYLDRADTLYDEAVLSVGERYKTDFPRKLLVISALFGQAAIAESKGEIDDSKQLLARIVEIANPEYPQLAAQATERNDTLGMLAMDLVLPSAADLPEPPPPAEIPDPASLLRTEAPDADAPATNTEGSGDASSLILEGGTSTPESSPDEPAQPTGEPDEPSATPGGDG